MNTLDKVEKQKTVYDANKKVLIEQEQKLIKEESKLKSTRNAFWEVVGAPPIPLFTKLDWRRLRMIKHYNGADIGIGILNSFMFMLILILLTGAVAPTLITTIIFGTPLMIIAFIMLARYNSEKRRPRTKKWRKI